MHSQLVDEVVEGRDAFAETLPSSDSGDKLVGLGAFLERITIELLPMIEDALREGTTGSGGTESLCETEGLSDGQVGLHVDKRSSGNGLLLVDDTTTLGEALVDSTDGVIRALDLNKEDRLLEARRGCDLRGIEHTSGGGHNLATTSVDGIGVQGHVVNVEADASHVLVDHDTLFGGPLEGSFHRILDLLQVLHLLGDVDKHVGTSGFRTEAPNLLGIIRIPFVVILELAGSLSLVLFGGNFVFLNSQSQLISERSSLTVDSVVLVG